MCGFFTKCYFNTKFVSGFKDWLITFFPFVVFKIAMAVPIRRISALNRAGMRLAILLSRGTVTMISLNDQINELKWQATLTKSEYRRRLFMVTAGMLEVSYDHWLRPGKQARAIRIEKRVRKILCNGMIKSLKGE